MIEKKARSAVLEAHDSIAIREFTVPEIRGDDALLEVERAGICYTDVDLCHGKFKLADHLLIVVQ